ncbi:DUF2061 domain-containing protein [Mucilaginibacter rubeus]|uniref:DUF2061 domain-containing protein n=1 Tax=Mucilaginibacter rubeus TaxID=2027860 RepID=A0AAE6JN26_9SPHI|nr:MULTISPECIES: DUF2061 domain-containing protein [Mucilaginibacter]QEM07650.1 DUF2061 domain-containing protein [Mucilaginibacter rubeus]QEM20105.1 DUF2061 domain-containing protein [Mucilaginibacter gossypii]QTE43182.1 DUF2061 domain-containing protein [Mucilaginibacter rubeus]QTE49782.1 DUF2061 domain-containing protein [Mucilaginibacter rubeus]QTE54876.1 DUF2061 domain-containing protein [Mucilaginibacter rubeus]
MIEKLFPGTHHAEETVRRSIVKAISYRAAILILDFAAIYLFTGQIKVAVGFMIISNVYTIVGYFFYERIWDKIRWGKIIYKTTDQ